MNTSAATSAPSLLHECTRIGAILFSILAWCFFAVELYFAAWAGAMDGPQGGWGDGEAGLAIFSGLCAMGCGGLATVFTLFQKRFLRGFFRFLVWLIVPLVGGAGASFGAPQLIMMTASGNIAHDYFCKPGSASRQSPMLGCRCDPSRCGG